MKALFLALSLVFSSAHAEYLSGEDLMQLMDGTELQQVQALAYIKGAHDASQTATHCAPPLADAQLTAIVRRVLERSPHMRAEYSADRFILVPLRAMFPCMRPASLIDS